MSVDWSTPDAEVKEDLTALAVAIRAEDHASDALVFYAEAFWDYFMRDQIVRECQPWYKRHLFNLHDRVKFTYWNVRERVLNGAWLV